MKSRNYVMGLAKGDAHEVVDELFCVWWARRLVSSFRLTTKDWWGTVRRTCCADVAPNPARHNVPLRCHALFKRVYRKELRRQIRRGTIFILGIDSLKNYK